MPEGDTIHRAAAALHRALAGRTVVRFETALAQLARLDADRPIAGRTVEGARAAGKHLLLAFSGDLVLRTHMRMSGSWHLYRPGVAWRRPSSAARVVVGTDAAIAVAFDVPVAEWLEGPRAVARQPDLAALGPDLLDPAFDAAEATRRLRTRPDREIGEALLDQRALAGVGNVFKNEILFVAGVHPDRPVGRLSEAELAELLAAARRLLLANVGPGAPLGRRTTGALDPGKALFVYGRSGEPCRRCGAPIAFERQGIHARTTYFCPRCQPAGA